MARTRTDYGKYAKKDTADTEIETGAFEPFEVSEIDRRVRIRTAPRITSDFTGNYLGDGWHKIVEVVAGEGSESGWGRLESRTGWVGLDFVKKSK